MHLFYLIAILSIFPVGYYMRRKFALCKNAGGADILEWLLMPVIFGAVGVLVVTIMISMIIGKTIPSVVQKDFTVNLVAMKSGEATRGTFVWGSGNIDGSIYYLVYVKNNDGSMTPHKITADAKVRIVEDDNLKDSGTWTQYSKVADPNALLVKWTFDGPRASVQSNELHVPRGTVRQSFSAN